MLALGLPTGAASLPYNPDLNLTMIRVGIFLGPITGFYSIYSKCNMSNLWTPRTLLVGMKTGIAAIENSPADVQRVKHRVPMIQQFQS